MAEFPNTIYEPRDIENKSGVVYDPTKKTTLFAEDIQKANEEIVAIETELGANPSGSHGSVAGYLDFLNSAVAESFEYYINILRGRTTLAYFSYTGNQRPFYIADNGDVYIAGLVMSGKNTYCIAVFKSTDDGMTFEQVGDIINPLSTAGLQLANSDSLRIRVNSSGHICVIFLGHSEAISTVWNLFAAVWEGSSWAVEAITSENTAGYDAILPNCDVDSAGNFHACCIQKTDGFTTYGVARYSKRTAGSWSAPISPVATTTRSPDQLMMCIDSNDYPVLSQRGNTSGYIEICRYNGLIWNIQAYTAGTLAYTMTIGPDDTVYIGGSSAVLQCTVGMVWSTLAFTSSGGAYQLTADATYLYAMITSIGNANTPSLPNGVVQRYRFSDGLIEYSEALHHYSNNTMTEVTTILNPNKNKADAVILQRFLPLCFFSLTPTY